MTFEIVPTAHGGLPPPGRLPAPDGPPWLLFVNEEYEAPGAFSRALAAGLQLHLDAAGFVCRWLPGDVQQHIDPATLEIACLEGPVFALRRDLFLQAGGFDPRVGPPALLVDLSARMRAAGGRFFYLPGACAPRKAPAGAAPEAAPAHLYAEQQAAGLRLAFKYGGVFPALGRAVHTLRRPSPMPGVRRALAHSYAGALQSFFPLLFRRMGKRGLFRSIRKHHGNFERVFGSLLLRGESPLAQPLAGGPFVSVVVRTYKRPGRLAKTLASLANQTYRNFEVVVVEDGEGTAGEVVQAAASGLTIRYHPTGEPVGRSRAGNLGMEMARGEYLNLLDDDDYFYPDHLELLVSAAGQHPETDMVIGTSVALMAHVVAESPYTLEVQSLLPMRFDRLDIFTMCQACQIGSCGVLYKKSLFERCGGLDEKLDAHEDWAMWLRFLAKAQRANPSQADVLRCTSVFFQPADAALARQRMHAYMQHDAAFFGDASIRFDVTLADMRTFYDGMLADVEHVYRQGTLEEWLEREKNRDISRG